MENKPRKDYFLPASIVIAGLIIGGAVVYNAGKSIPSDVLLGTVNPIPAAGPSAPRPIGPDDHVLGNPDAEVVIFEYSDFECSFCREFHPTMERLINEYGDRVAWVYRHFILGIFPASERIAIASECAAETGGNEAFWDFADAYFSDRGFRGADVSDIADAIGLDVAKFNSCLTSGRHLDKINSDSREVKNVGGQGTPYSFIVGPDGSVVDVIGGALPYSDVRFMVESILR